MFRGADPPIEDWNSVGARFCVVGTVGRGMVAASLFAASFVEIEKSLLNKLWPEAAARVGELKIRISQSKSCLLPPETAG